MHGHDARSVLVVNAEVYSMGGVGIDTKTSPWRAAIKKVQDKLRQEYDVLDERIKELEFLQKGGDPLEFKFGHAVSVSVQSTSLPDQQADQFVASETKGSFPFTVSPQGDSVESSGRPGGSQLCEPNSADNLNLFDGENKFIEGERTFRCVSRNNIAPPEKTTQMAGNQNVKELGDSVALGVPRKAYKRRYRTRPSRDGAKSNSNEVHTCGGPSYSVTNDSKGLIFDLEKQWSRNISGQTTSSNGVVTSKTVPSNDHGIVELDTLKAAEPVNEMEKVCQPNYVSDIVFSTDIINSQIDQCSVGVSQESPTEVVLEGSELLSMKEKGGFGGLEIQWSHMEKVDDLASSRRMYGSSNAKSDMKIISNDGKHISAASASNVLDSASSCTQASLSLIGKKDSEICIDPRNIDSIGHMKDQPHIAERNCVLESNIVKHVKEIKADGICGFVSEECNSVQKNNKENGFEPELVEDLVRNESTLRSEIKDEAVTCKESLSPAVLKTEVAEAVGISSAFHVGPQSEIKIKLVTRADEDSILEEARIIEGKRKRIIELSSVNTLIESRCKSHWDFVLEEMPWLANDFVQERLWKISAASRMSYHAATTSQLWFQEINDSWKHKKISHTLAKAVMDFWQSVKGMNKKVELQSPKKGGDYTLKEYAVKFLKCNNFDVPDSQNEAPATPEIEDNLFYTVSPGAAETYRKAIESQVLQYEKIHTKMREGVETSACETIADYAYEEDERELTMHHMRVAFGRSNSSRFFQKRKLHMPTYGGRSYAIVADLSLPECKENKVRSQQSMPRPKRPTSSLNVSFPKKRVRTCYRSRVLSPFKAGTSSLQVSPKTDASSETSSFQDDQSILHGGSLVPNSVEVESVGNFQKRLKIDSAEVSMKSKKKRAKYPGSSYDQRWLGDSNFQIEQGVHSRKRLECHQFASNGCNGINRIMRPSLETSSEYSSPVAGSAPSPSASQFSNMPNTNKFTRMLTGRDLNKKAKSLKMPAGLAGSGSQWSPFEDQALVVLVHDMGPNWELVSDAINSTLEFKCVYRKPMECKEHHKILMVTNGDGADSTEEMRSSQPYPSTLPGIPKGSARQLFQRLLGPVEEATRKSHFEKIILIGQKYLFGKTQGKQDPKQLQQPHSSHTNALSQVVPNNLNGLILTPLDLCDAPSSSLDISSLGFQNPHSSGLAVSNQGGLGPMSPSSAISASVQGSLNVIHGNNFSSPSSLLNPTVRSTSMPVDEQKRMHHSNQLLLGRNISISSGPGAPQGPDHGGVSVLPSGNGMGMICGTNGGMLTARHGFQGIASPSMLGSGSMTSSMVAMPNTVNMHPGVGSGQGNSMLRPHDNLHMMGPIQNQETPRQMMIADLQVQDLSQAVPPPFGGLVTSCPNQTCSSSVPSYPPHHHQPSQLSHMLSSPLHSHASGAANHASTNTQQPSYASHLTNGKQMQRRHVKKKQKFNTSNSLTPSVQQHQLPLSPPFHSSPQITSQSPPHASLSPLSSTSSVASMPQHPLKYSMSRHGHFRSAQSGPTTNKLSKQQKQQTSRKHTQQRQQNIKVSKRVGQGNALNQDMQIGPSALNQTSLNSRTTIATEKGDQLTNSVQNQGLYTGSATNSVCPAKSSSALDMGQPQQKMHPGKTATKPLKPMAPRSANMGKGHSMITTLGSRPPAGYHPFAMPVIRSSNHQPLPHSQSEVHTQKRLLNESRTTESQFSQHTVSNSTPIETVKATASECNIANSTTSPNVSQLKGAEPLIDSVGSLRTAAAGREEYSLGIQVLNQRLSSGCLSPVGHDASLQWEQQQ